MASSFNVNSAEGYERLMGRWSRRLAVPFIDFAGLADGDRVADIGCGTGSLTFTLAGKANVHEIAAIDFSPVFVAEAQRRSTDDRIRIQQGDACSLPFEEDYFDRAMALLVLHFIPQTGRAVSEMSRVVRPGGVVAAAVWDHYGGLPSARIMWDTLAVQSEGARQARARYFSQPMERPGELKRCFIDSGLRDVRETSLTIRMDFESFDDYWEPIAGGEGPQGKYIASLSPEERPEVDRIVRAAYEGGEPDGPRSFAATAWACRGIVPG